VPNISNLHAHEWSFASVIRPTHIATVVIYVAEVPACLVWQNVCYFVNLLCATDRHCCQSPSVVDSNTDSDSALCRPRELLRLCNDGSGGQNQIVIRFKSRFEAYCDSIQAPKDSIWPLAIEDLIRFAVFGDSIWTEVIWVRIAEWCGQSRTTVNLSSLAQHATQHIF